MSRRRGSGWLWVGAGLGLLTTACLGSAGTSGPEWKGLPSSARSAADSIMALVARGTHLAPQRSRGEINPIYLNCDRPAARFELQWRNDRQHPPDPLKLVERELPRLGWTYDEQSPADGPDGTVYSFHRGKLICVVEGRWDGGDESDTTVVLDPTMSMLVDVGDARPCPDRPVKD